MLEQEISESKILSMIKQREITPTEGVALFKRLKEKDNAVHEKRSKSLYLQYDWEQDEANTAIHPQTGTILIFGQSERALSSLTNLKEMEDAKLIRVLSDQEFKEIREGVFTVDPVDKESYIKLFQALNEKQMMPTKIIHQWSFQSVEFDRKDRKKSIDFGFVSIFYIAQAMLERKLTTTIDLLFFYKGNHPLYASIKGLMRTLHLENPDYFFRTIEVIDHWEEEQEAKLIATELSITGKAPVRYSKNVRYTKRISKHTKTGNALSGVKKNGVYLITGGAGGVGLIFARHFAEKYQAKLILTGRSTINHEIEKKLKELKNLGGNAVYMESDIGNPDSVRHLMNQVIVQFGKVDGVIHGAGLLRDSFLVQKTMDEAQEVLRPKVDGTIHLLESLEEQKLDFFVFFSSTTAIMGNLGQADYAFANSFMDEMAQLRSLENPDCKYLSMNWPYWLNGGMSISKDDVDNFENTMGILPLPDQEGVDALEYALANSFTQMMVVYGEEQRITETVINQYDKVKNRNSNTIDVQNNTKELETIAKTILSEIISKEAKVPIEEISYEDSMDKFGIDSVMILGLNRRLEKIFGEMSKTIFFEYQNINELSTYFVKKYPTILMERLDTQEVPKTVQEPAHNVVVNPRRERIEQKRSRYRTTTVQERSGKEVDEMAIVGLSGCFPMAENIEALWENLKAGKDCITEVPQSRWNLNEYEDYCKWGGFIEDVDKFDPLFFRISPKEAQLMDPQERIFLKTAYHTFEDAGYTKTQINNTNIGVFVGVMYGQYQMFSAEETMKGNPSPLMSSYASIANRVSYFFNLYGPSMAVDTMCSSSITSIHLACESIKNGECDAALAGGVNVSIHPNKYLVLSSGNFTSSDGRCRSFGEGGDGYVPGEGSGAVLIKPLQKALEDNDQIYGIIKASAVNHGGKTNGFTVPNPNAQANVISSVLKKSKIDPRTISYVEAHGTGTSLGDPIEIAGLTKAFGEGDKTQYCPIGSVKSNIGHLESAAGIAAVTKVLLQMKHKQLAPSIHCQHLNPNIDFMDSPFFVQRELETWEQPLIDQNGVKKRYPRIAAISAFGAGGSNAHIVIQEYEKDNPSKLSKETPSIVTLSAKSEESLFDYAKALLKYLEQKENKTDTQGEETAELQNVLTEDVKKIISDVLHVDDTNISIKDTIEEYTSDPLDFTEIVKKLNKRYRLDLPVNFLEKSKPMESSIKRMYEENRVVLQKYYQQDISKETEEFGGSMPTLQEIAYTYQVYREPMKERMAIVASTMEELNTALSDYVKNHRQSAHIFVSIASNKKEKVNVKQLVEAGEYQTLASLWAEGAEIDWKSMYQTHIAPISLPLYPFAKERYWFSPKKEIENPQVDRTNTTVNNQALHPLIDRNESTMEEQVFVKEIGDYNPYIDGCEVFKHRVLPATLFLEMLTAAGNLSVKGKKVRGLIDVRWKNPLILHKGLKTIKLKLQKQKSGFTGSLITDHNREKPFIQAQAVLDFGNPLQEVFADIEALKQECRTKISGESFYQKLENIGLNYNKDYHIVKEMAFHNQKAISTIEQKQAEESKFLFHPMMMEGVVQSLNLFLQQENGDEMPRHLWRVDCVELGEPIKDSCYVIILKVENKLDVKIVNRDGRVAGNMTGVEMAPIEGGYTEVKDEDLDLSFLVKEFRRSQKPTAYQKINKGKTLILVNDETAAVAHRLNLDKKVIVNGNEDARKTLEEAVDKEEFFQCFLDMSDLYSNPKNIDGHDFQKLTVYQTYISQAIREDAYLIHLTKGLNPFQSKCLTLAGADTVGLVKMLGKEYKKVQARTIDLDEYNETFIATLIQDELTYQDEYTEICYRNGLRYTPVMKELEIADSFKERSINTDKVVVLTGGTRGIGAEIAEHLVTKGVKKLVIMGRQAFPDRAEWDAYSGLNSEMALKIRRIQELEKKGVIVDIYTESLTDRQSLTEYFRGIRKNLGTIGGVIHCAGTAIMNDPAFINKRFTDMEKVLEPKITGLDVLHEVVSNDALDFFLLFSSVAGALPALGAGMSDYSAANAYMDCFAAYWQERTTTHYQSINWCRFRETGMEGEVGTAYNDLGLTDILTKDGLLILDKLLNYKTDSVIMPLLIDRETWEPEYLLTPRSTNELQKKEVIKMVSEEIDENSKSDTRDKLKQLFSEELMIPLKRLEDDIPFAEFGVDSILLVGIVKKVEQWIGEIINPMVFIEHSTLNELSQYLENEVIGTLKAGKIQHLMKTNTRQKRKRFALEFSKGYENRFYVENSILPATKSGGKIAVIGMSAHVPGAQSWEEYWDNLKEGKSGIVKVPKGRWDVERVYSHEYQPGKSISKWGGFIDHMEEFDAEYFGLTGEDAMHMDPLMRQFMEVSAQVINDAGYEKKELGGKKIGVFVGSRISNFSSRIDQPKKNTVTGLGQNFIAAHISHFYNLKGPNLVVDTACSSSLVSIHLACQSILQGESEAAIAGGVDILLDETPYILLSEGKALSPDGKSYTFDERANGFVPGEGCGAVMLKELDRAVEDGDNIYAVIEATAVNNDGRTMGITTPNPEAQIEVIKEALDKAQAKPDTISYIEAHGTGTMIGDPIELKALQKVFHEVTDEKQFCAVGSVKTNIGHLLSAAGIASFIKVAASLHHKQIPPTLNCIKPNPRFKFDDSPFFPNTELKSWEPRKGVRRAGLSAFGFGGTNAHIIVREFTADDRVDYKQTRETKPAIEFHRKRYWIDREQKTVQQELKPLLNFEEE